MPDNKSNDKGFINNNGIKFPYFTQGQGRTCLVVGDALTPSRAISDNLKKHFKFIFLSSRMIIPLPENISIENITLDTIIEDIETARQTLGLTSFCIFGHSISGMLALEYARKYPSYITHIIINGTPPFVNQDFFTRTETYWQQNASVERKNILKQNHEKITDDIIKQSSVSDGLSLEYIRNGPKYWYNASYDCSLLLKDVYWNGEIVNHIFTEMVKDYDITQSKKIITPVFLSLGRSDFSMPYILWNDYKKYLPNLTCRIFDKSGHWAIFEEHDLYDQELLKWLDTSSI